MTIVRWMITRVICLAPQVLLALLATHVASAQGLPAAQRQIVVRTPSVRSNSEGHLVLEPNVNVMGADGEPAFADPHGVGGFVQYMWSAEDQTTPGAIDALRYAEDLQPMPLELPSPGPAEPIFEELISDVTEYTEQPAGLLCRWFGYDPFAEGIGRERLGMALFEMDNSQPFGNFRIRFASAVDHSFPDRSEFMWARINGRGPQNAETSVDYQEARLALELGSARFSTTTEVPFRWLDPITNTNHAGLSDLNITTKTVMIDGVKFQLTQLFRSYMNTGAPSQGLGTGHVSLEPGFLFRYKLSDMTYLHSEVKYWFALGGDLVHSGQVLRYGWGISHLYYENDYLAVIPTLELVFLSFLNGQQTEGAITTSADGVHVINLHPGVRFVYDKGGDLGLFELGVGGGYRMTEQTTYAAIGRLELRWSF